MSSSCLLSPYANPNIGSFKSRIVMAAMTRSFANEYHECTAEMADYYERRASGGVGLILTEGIVIHPSADGYNHVPHLYTLEHAKSWKKAVNAVHQHGTKIYAQLWHCGRISHPDYTNGFDIVSSTNKPASGINRQNGKPYGTPRALGIEEIRQVYNYYCKSAQLAIEAGFDGVQLHMGHGYLVDQFLDARINDRNDDYGGSVENRCRFALELLDTVIRAIGSNHVMVRISPSRMMGELYEWPDLTPMLERLLTGFDATGLRQLDISCANADYFTTSGKIIRSIRHRWPHLLIGGASLSISDAEDEIKNGYLDLITWGRALIANHDFGHKVAQGVELLPFDDNMREKLF